MKFELFRGILRQWYWRLVSRNGKIIAQSEGYKRRNSAIKTINSIKAGALSTAKLIEK